MQELAHEPRRSRRFPASSLGRLVWRLTSDHPQGLAKTAPARSDSEKRSHCRGRVRKESVFTIWHSASVRPALHLLHQLCLLRSRRHQLLPYLFRLQPDSCPSRDRLWVCPVPARPGRECHSAGNHCLLPPGSCDLRPAPFCTRYRLLSGCARRARNLPAKRLQRWLSCPARGGRPAYPTARRRKIGLGARGCQPLRRDLRRLPARG